MKDEKTTEMEELKKKLEEKLKENVIKQQLYSLHTIEFKRDKDSPYEPGLSFNDGKIIMDMYGEIVPSYYVFNHRYGSLSIDLNAIFKNMPTQGDRFTSCLNNK